MGSVFISYSRQNLTFAERLARDLDDAGFDIWLDVRQIKGGQAWQDAIFKGVNQAEIVIVCLSPSAVESEWVRREIRIAQELDKTIIPVMVEDAYDLMLQHVETTLLRELQFINFEGRYESAVLELLHAMPSPTVAFMRAIDGKSIDDVDPDTIPNPFKGLEAFQQTDARIFFGREDLITKLLDKLREDRRFIAVVGASGSGKSSLVRAGLIPAIRRGELAESQDWPLVIFTPGSEPIKAMAKRLMPVLGETLLPSLMAALERGTDSLHLITEGLLADALATARLALVVDQFEETFTRASKTEANRFLDLLRVAATVPDGQTLVLLTMRADFFDRLSAYPDLAALFEQENMVIATEMTPENLRLSIEGPAAAVGLVYDHGLTDRILEDVRKQPGSLPLLQYALKELYERRDGRRLSFEAYEQIGGVQRALAQHAEDTYTEMNAAQQDIMRRMLLRLVEMSETGEATRRKVCCDDLRFRDISDAAVQEVIDLLTAQESRLLIASREIVTEQADDADPTVWLEVSHEALIREWERFTNWVAEDEEALRYGGELLKAANDWKRADENPDFLLHGARVDRALHWLETADANDLQRAYIQASAAERDRVQAEEQARIERELEMQRQLAEEQSRVAEEQRRVAEQQRQLAEEQRQSAEYQKRAANRLRFFLVGLAIFLIVAILLAFYALDQQSLAEDRAQTAIVAVATSARRADEAESLVLADRALQTWREGNTELAISLALETVNIPNPPAQARRVLAEVAYQPGPRKRLRGHSSRVMTVAYSPDGKTALSGDYDGNLVLWDLTTGDEIRRLVGNGERFGIWTVDYSPDGKTALSGDYDGNLVLWDLTTGDEIRRSESVMVYVEKVAFSPDGRTSLVAGCRQTWDDDCSQGILLLVEVATGEILHDFKVDGEHPEDIVFDIAYSPDGSMALSVGYEDLILWNMKTWEEIRRFDITLNGRSVAFSPDGHTALFGTSFSLVKCDVMTGECSDNLLDEPEDSLSAEGDLEIRTVSFSPDGKMALSAGIYSKLILLDVESGTAIRSFEGHGLFVWEAVFSPDGKTILSASEDDSVILWDVEAGNVIHQFDYQDDGIVPVAWNPEGHTALVMDKHRSLLLYDIESGKTIRPLEARSGIGVIPVVFSPDGRTALAVDDDRNILQWDVETGALIKRFEGHEIWMHTLAFGPDGRTLLSAAGDEFGEYELILWDVNSGEEIRRFEGHTMGVWGAALSPDGQFALSAAGTEVGDNELILWDVNSGEEIRRFEGHTSWVTSVAFSLDGKTALSGAGDNSMILWDIFNGTEVRRFEGHTGWVTSIAFSADGELVLSGDSEGTVMLWDVSSGELIRQFDGHSGRVFSVAFGPQNKTAFSVDVMGRAFVWRLDTLDELVVWTYANRAVRELTCSERRDYIDVRCDEEGHYPTRTPYFGATQTPKATAMPTIHLTRTPVNSTATLTPSLTPSFTPESISTANLGINHGEVPVGGGQVWMYEGSAEEIVTIRVQAADSEIGMRLMLRASDGTILLEDDGWRGRRQAEIEDFELPRDDMYEIEIRSYENLAGGSYTMLVEMAGFAGATFTPSPTLTATPTLIPSPTATPAKAGNASVGSNRGEIAVGNGEIWSYEGQTGEVLTIRVNADNPAGTDTNTQTRLAEGLLDTYLVLRGPDQVILAENDDIDAENPEQTNSMITFQLPVDGEYHIEVRGFEDASGGAYTLIIESQMPEEATLTPTLTRTPTLTATP